MPAPRPGPAELQAKIQDGTYVDFVRAAMTDFCFTIDPHIARDRIWFGNYTLTVNRNVAFNFFDRDPRDDSNLEPYPVVRGDRQETLDTRVRPAEDDPSADYVVPVFFLPKRAWTEAVVSMEGIVAAYPGFRTLPDTWFADEPIIVLVRDRLLKHPAVKAERAADWPELLR